MNQKPGIKTSEFWLTAVVNIAGSVLGILAAYGLVKQEHSSLWLSLINSLAVAIIPLALALVNYAYINGRSRVKEAQLRQAWLRQAQPPV